MNADQQPQVPVVATLMNELATTPTAASNLPSDLPIKIKNKSGPKRTTFQTLIDRHFIQEKLTENIPQYRIAELLNARPGISDTLSARQVCEDCHALEELWRKRTVADRTYWVSHTLRNIDKLESELWRAYWRSTQNAESQRVEASAGDLPNAGDSPEVKKRKLKAAAQTIIKTSEGQCGDPQYLRLILDLQEKRIKLLGHESPLTIKDVTNKDTVISYEEANKLLLENARLETFSPTRRAITSAPKDKDNGNGSGTHSPN